VAVSVTGSRESEKKGDAQALLTSRLGDSGKGIAVSPKIGKVVLREALQAVIDDQTTRGRKSIDATQRRIDLHVLPYFGPDRRMSTISGQDVESYRAFRMTEQKAKLATTNRELAVLRRAFRLARKRGVLMVIPDIETPKEDNARTGFLEPAQFDAICAHLPADLQAPVRFAYITGWRFKSEVLPLTADRVDLQVGAVKLHPGETKNGRGRTFMLTVDLRRILTAALANLGALKQRGIVSGWVFHRADGTRILDMRKRWKTACEAAGYPHALFHDFRRSAVRTLERSGVPRSTAMSMVGHETESIYRRYAIQDEVMLREGAARLDAYAVEQKAKAKNVRRGELRRFQAAENRMSER
jgi:integrase